MTAAATEAAFRAALTPLAGGDQDKIGIAVSGGGDSMALLAMAERAGLRLAAATVDHGLRPEAAEEARLVARFCQDLGIPHTVLPLQGLTPGANLAARARTARFEALAAWAEQFNLRTVLLGHTRDDQAETVILRLARGSGTDGLAAMAPLRHWRGLRWARPLLQINRSDLRDWLRSQGIGWVEDPSNDDRTQARVKVRQAMEDLAELGLTKARLAGTARQMARQRAVLEAAGDRLWHQAVQMGGLGEIYLDRAALTGELADTALRVLARALVEISGAPYRPRLAPLEEILASLETDFAGRTLAGCRIIPHGTQILICREPAAVLPAPLLDGHLWDGRWQVECAAQSDLWVAPLGMAGLERSTALLRELGNPPPPVWAAAPRAARAAAPAVYSGAEADPDLLIAVPSAGLALGPGADRIRISPPTADSLRHHEAE